MGLIVAFTALSILYQQLPARNITGIELLQKTITYHDPGGSWPTLGVIFTFAQGSPTKGEYSRVVGLDNSRGTFTFLQEDNEKTVEFDLTGEACEIKLNGSKEYSEEDIKKYRLSCDRAKMYRNYYTYLYGLPMKLMDKGTIVEEVVSLQDFQGKQYYALKVNYEESVGSDAWYFYINTQTFAMEGYRFYHDEEKNDGEYITLEGVQIFDGIKIPKTRKWYTNSDDKYLGTDDLVKAEILK